MMLSINRITRRLAAVSLAGAALMRLSLEAPVAFAQSPAEIPAFDLEAVNGARASRELLEGKVALIDFWATWCEPCLREIPHWNELHERYRDQDFVVLGIALQSGPAREVKLHVEKLNIRYPVAIGDRDVEHGFGGVVGFPATFLVDRSGRIRKKYLGQSALKHVQIERDIQLLLRAGPSAPNAYRAEKDVSRRTTDFAQPTP